MGSTVTISVSTGIPESSTASITYTLPNGVGVSGVIKYYLNDKLIDTEKDILFSGKQKTYEVEGSGDENTLVVTANEKKIYECSIDFTKIPGEVSGEKEFEYSEDVALPDLTNKVKAEAESALKAAGFKDYSFKTENSDTVDEGRVVSTDPIGGATAKYPVDTHITVVISLGPKETKPTTTEKDTAEEDTTDEEEESTDGVTEADEDEEEEDTTE